ncbi:MAG: SlyX family protein [Thiomonas sp.]
MNPPPIDPETDARLTRLEEKFGFAEDLLDALNALVAKQQDQITHLMRELGQLQSQRADDQPSNSSSLLDQLPPHY